MHDTFPPDSLDHPFVEMADIFYAEFLRTTDLSAACRAAVEFVSDHEEEILAPIRDDRVGSFSFETYTPSSFCPLR